MSPEDQLQYKPTIEEIAAQKWREWETEEIIALRKKVLDSDPNHNGALVELTFRAVIAVVFGINTLD
jgi:hypothetical protein